MINRSTMSRTIVEALVEHGPLSQNALWSLIADSEAFSGNHNRFLNGIEHLAGLGIIVSRNFVLEAAQDLPTKEFLQDPTSFLAVVERVARFVDGLKAKSDNHTPLNWIIRQGVQQ